MRQTGLCCFGRNENTKGADRQLKYVIYCLEIGCRAADEAGVLLAVPVHTFSVERNHALDPAGDMPD